MEGEHGRSGVREWETLPWQWVKWRRTPTSPAALWNPAPLRLLLKGQPAHLSVRLVAAILVQVREAGSSTQVPGKGSGS